MSGHFGEGGARAGRRPSRLSSTAPSGENRTSTYTERETEERIYQIAIGRCDNIVMPELANDRCRVKNRRRRRRLVLIECLLEPAECVDDRIYL